MLRFFSTLEKAIIVLLVVIIATTSWYLYSRFIVDHSELIPTEGGIYTEGVVGRPQYLNPALLLGNPVDKDISQLIFSGLTKYNPHTGLIEDDIATSEKSKDNLTYTFRIVADAKWHDGEPVTADDVVFTYSTVLKSDSFPNAALKQAFSDVKVDKVDERVVRFRLASPYSFFLSNVTIGLLPKHILGLVPPENLEKSDFNQNPIGSGPYLFASWTVSSDTHEVTLKRNDAYYAPLPKIQTLIFRAFPDAESLTLAENTLTGFRMSNLQSPQGEESNRFDSFDYRLPQYSALFLNTQSDILSNKKVRFALLLATNKDRVLEIVKNAEVVDTPVLESKADLDIEYSLDRARGALFDAEWNVPGKAKEKKDADAKKASEVKKADGSGGPVNMKLIDEAAELKFTLKSVEDTWITLAVDGVLKPSFLFTKDQTKEFTAKNSLTLRTVGNAAGLSIQVNGVSLKSFGTSGQVLRWLVLDRKSLEKYVVEPEPVPEPEVKPEEPKPEPKPEEKPSQQPELDQVRINDEGKRLILRLVTAQEPAVFLKVAEEVQHQWLQAGVKVVIETYSLPDLQEKITKRDYDVLLFGQNLGYNLDAFPFWHSSQSETGLNLSNYRSLEADNLLVRIRNTFDERTKQELLEKLKKVIAEDTPAVFLYNPTHSYLIDRSVKNVQMGKLSNHSDRFIDLAYWYLKQDYRLHDDLSFWGTVKWLISF